jgi:hypothetical protein
MNIFQKDYSERTIHYILIKQKDVSFPKKMPEKRKEQQLA